jgi:high-affinity nickel-transport protein
MSEAMIGFLLGLRHGADPDHMAAISDIAAASGGGMRALRLSTVYAGGHALMLLALGLVATSFGSLVPAGVDEVFGRIIGGTLVVLAVVVAYNLFKGRAATRASILRDAVRRGKPASKEIGVADATIVGLIHGIGAETPTQMVLLVAASATGGLWVVLAFVGGLFLTNTAIAVLAGTGFALAKGSRAFLVLSGMSAAYSGLLGISYILA